MLVHQKVQVGETLLVETALPPGSHLVRLHPRADEPYDRMIVVTERNEGRELFLSGWIGPPLSLGDWRAAKAALFPAAETVAWERRLPNGRIRVVRMQV